MKITKNETYEKNEKITTNIEHFNDEGFVNKVYLVTISSKVERHKP